MEVNGQLPAPTALPPVPLPEIEPLFSSPQPSHYNDSYSRPTKRMLIHIHSSRLYKSNPADWKRWNALPANNQRWFGLEAIVVEDEPNQTSINVMTGTMFTQSTCNDPLQTRSPAADVTESLANTWFDAVVRYNHRPTAKQNRHIYIYISLNHKGNNVSLNGLLDTEHISHLYTKSNRGLPSFLKKKTVFMRSTICLRVSLAFLLIN